jgi:hypothetical protein
MELTISLLGTEIKVAVKYLRAESKAGRRLCALHSSRRAPRERQAAASEEVRGGSFLPTRNEWGEQVNSMIRKTLNR